MSETITSAELEALLAEFARSGVRELHVRRGAFELHLSNDPATPKCPPEHGAAQALRTASSVPPPVMPRPPTAPDLPDGAFVVGAPNLGIFYRAPKPGAKAYVELGATVEAGAELCLIEVMKLFTAVRTERGGRIYAIFAEDGAMVEAGQPLFAIVPQP